MEEGDDNPETSKEIMIRIKRKECLEMGEKETTRPVSGCHVPRVDTQLHMDGNKTTVTGMWREKSHDRNRQWMSKNLQ